jgi:hypothetical protein
MHEVSIIDPQRNVLDSVQVEHSARVIADLARATEKAVALVEFVIVIGFRHSDRSPSL